MNNLQDHEFTDFQQLPSWRRLVTLVADELTTVTGQDLVVVQSVLHAEYWMELQQGLEASGHRTLHVVLDADPEAIHARIDADPDGAEILKWRHEHVQTFVEARGWLRDASDLIDTTDLAPAEVVSAIVASVPAERVTA